jgi:hypothetical protein
MAAGNAPVPDAGASSSDAGAGPFVINLTSSTTPMALSHPDSPELKRFSFFVSRRREDNRERFRLHMGYFATLAEAEEWLNVIRDLYPGAWAGEAPGKKLRARAAAAELAKQLPAPPPAPAAAASGPQAAAGRSPAARDASAAKATPASRVAPASAVPAAASLGTPASPVAIEVPTLQAAPTYAPAPQPAVAASAAPMLEAVAQAAAALAAVAKTAMAQSTPYAASGDQTMLAPSQWAAPGGYPPAGDHTASAPSSRAPASAADHTVMAPNPFVAATVNKAASQPAFTPAPPAPVAAPQPPRAAARPAAAPASASVAAAPKSPAQSSPGQSPKPAAAAPPARPTAGRGGGLKKNSANALTDGSNVREVMASLDETGETRQMQIPPGVRPSAPAARPAAPVAASASANAPSALPKGGAAGRAPQVPAQNAAPSTPQNLAQLGAQNVAKSARGPAAPAAEKPRTAAPPPARVPAVDSQSPDMSDTQVLRMLETRRPDDGDKGNDDANAGISLLKPDDTQTRRALKEAVIDNAPVSFAVQLQWSVQPVELDKVPPLAIFSAYTLYTVEGSREGRKWYGLRLGFFSDAISAKQVAYYVRSEFASVAVVPVSPAEKARASDEETKAATGAFQRKRVEQKVEEFKLFDDDQAAMNEPPAPKPAAEAPKGAAARTPARKNKPLGRVKAKEQRSPKTLEETLEILGASDLEIDNGRGELLNDTGVRHLRVEVQKNTPFAKLLDRISERVRKN